jgi:ClpP class serine protease
VKAIANGKVWTGEQAKSMNLIDGVGDFETAVADTAKSVGIKGEPTLVRPDKDRKNADGSAARRCFPFSAGAREDAGAAGGILLPVEVGGPVFSNEGYAASGPPCQIPCAS